MKILLKLIVFYLKQYQNKFVMREKNGLDKNVFIDFTNENFKENRAKKELAKKISEFNSSCINCKNFTLKKEELRIKVYWCKKINKACIYSNCPKINKNI